MHLVLRRAVLLALRRQAVMAKQVQLKEVGMHTTIIILEKDTRLIDAKIDYEMALYQML